MKALICIPTYNERDNVGPLATEIFKYVPHTCELLFIDDGSPDGTGALLDEMARANPRIHVVHRAGKLGLGTAYVKGFQWGLEHGFDWLFEMDADFSHDPAHLEAFFQAIESGRYDAMGGSRYVDGGGVKNWEQSRLLLSQMGSIYARLWLRHPVKDWTGGFNAWSAKLVREMKLDTIRSKGYCFQIELKYRALCLGRAFLEIPIIFQERRAGHSKMSGSIVKEALAGVARLRLRFENGTLFKN